MNALASGVRAVAEDVRAQSDRLNRLDAIAGDGDLGVTMNIGAAAILELLPSLENGTLSELLNACGRTLATKAPSTSGTLIATACLRAAKRAGEIGAIDANGLADLIDVAANGIAERGGAGAGAKTMLDALLPAAAAAREAAAGGATVAQALQRASEAAEKGVEATKAMEPKFGRAGWLAERSMGHEDAGARLVAIMFDSLARHGAAA